MLRPLPAATSATVEPAGIAPGCQLRVAAPSAVDTAPAAAASATAEPTTGGGTGAGTTGAVVAAGADVEPPRPVAVMSNEIDASMSSGVSVYEDAVALTIATHCVVQRRHWNVNDVGAPVHARTDDVSVCPTCGVPETVGALVVAGRVVVDPDADTEIVAGEDAAAEPPGADAVTATARAWPTSSVTGRYVSAVAPGIGAQPAPAASHRCHW